MHSARTTKDIDLTLHDGTGLSKDPKERGEQVRAMLQDAAAMRFDDYFEFLVGEAREDLGWRSGRRQPVPRPSTNGWSRLRAISRRPILRTAKSAEIKASEVAAKQV